MKLDIFREIVGAYATPSIADLPHGFPPGELRFVLEYPAAPGLDTERKRLAVQFPWQSFRLDALSGHASLACFLVLSFPAFEKVFRQSDLFALSYQIAESLELVSVEPDLGCTFFTEPEQENLPHHEGAFLRAICQVDDAPPPATDWALDMVRAPQAWTIATGAGIRIGHADTGYTTHAELEHAIDVTSAIDLIDPNGSGIDPLHPGAANPGHGLATGSVIASRREGRITGVAPEASLVPIRCIDDVKVFNQAPIAAAIAYAQEKDCPIVSMSLGGVPSRALHAAIHSAIERGAIVLAAAGNCVSTVVWPARYDEVIAVAGCNHRERPWKGSCQGDAVDITAPAEHVWCASAKSGDDAQDAIKAGQGTSYAVAMVAGAAALWLERHGRADIAHAAAQRGISVQDLFRIALQATARRPAEWDSDHFGAGILDVLALVNMSLETIPAPIQREAAADSTRSIRRMLGNEHGTLVRQPDFDWERYGCELATIALHGAREGAALSELNRESKTPATVPSAQLAAAIDKANEPALLRFGIQRDKGLTIVRPLLPEPTSIPAERLRNAITITPASGLESAIDRFDTRAAQAYLLNGGLAEQLALIEQRLRRMDLSTDTRQRTVHAAEKALISAARNGKLDADAQFGFEALVALTGRPAIRTVGGKVNLADPQIEDWHDRLYVPVKNWHLNDKVGSVGRIDVDGRHVGTGFVIAPKVILTNRHVLQDIATPLPTRDRPQSWRFDSGQATIDFADDPGSDQGRQRFVITSVLATGDKYIEDAAFDFTRLDAAILEVESVNAAGTPLPAPLAMSAAQEPLGRYTEIVTIGYPARLARLPKTTSGAIDEAGLSRLDELYKKYNVRYMAPGEIKSGQPLPSEAADAWTMRYDATTLGGCSGSCVLRLDPQTGVVGLHFGGTWRKENFGHAIGMVKSRADLFKPVSGIPWID